MKLKLAGAFCVPRYHTGGGLAMLWYNQVELTISTYSRNHIDAWVKRKGCNSGFQVTDFYGNPETHKRKESWALLKHLGSLGSDPWVCMGDFNEILDHSERMGRGSRPTWQIEDFRKAVVCCELHDMGFVGNPFTWRNKKEAHRNDATFATARLDRVFASASWMVLNDGACVSHFALQNSDHCLVLLSIQCSSAGQQQKRKRVFRFEAMWTLEEECSKVIDQAWNSEVLEGSPMYQVVEKLKRCRGSLIARSKVKFGELASTIKAKQVQLQNLLLEFLGCDTPELWKLQDELNDLLEKEEVY